MAETHGYQQYHVLQGNQFGVQTHNIQNAGPTPIIIIQQQAPPKPTKYATTTSVVTGIMQLAAGMLSIVFQIIALFGHTRSSKISSGIWCALFFLIAGSLGIAAGKTKNKCFIVGHLVMCIIAAFFAFVMLSISSVDAAISTVPVEEYGTGRPVSNLEFAMYILLVILALFEAVVAIIGSAISCCGVCCTSTPVHPGIVQYIPQPGSSMVPVYNPYHNDHTVAPASHSTGAPVSEPAPPPYYGYQGTPPSHDSCPGVHKPQ